MSINTFRNTKDKTVTIKSSSARITLTALFAALACMATLLIQIQTPTGGYVNLGDCFVLLSGWVLGPIYGGLAAGIGSMLADVISGYAFYAPATFIIKALMAVCAYFIFKMISGGRMISYIIASIISAVTGELVMIFGYFAFESVIMGMGAAAVQGIPGNAIQGVTAIFISTILHSLIKKVKL